MLASSAALQSLENAQGSQGFTPDTAFTGDTMCGVRRFARLSNFVKQSQGFELIRMETRGTLYEFGRGSSRSEESYELYYCGVEEMASGKTSGNTLRVLICTIDVVAGCLPWIWGTSRMIHWGIATGFSLSGNGYIAVSGETVKCTYSGGALLCEITQVAPTIIKAHVKRVRLFPTVFTTIASHVADENVADPMTHQMTYDDVPDEIREVATPKETPLPNSYFKLIGGPRTPEPEKSDERDGPEPDATKIAAKVLDVVNPSDKRILKLRQMMWRK